MSDTSLPPPGWYDDPAGTHGSRWWDGRAWTDHVRHAAPNDDPPPPPGTVVPTGAGDAGLPLSLAAGNRRVVMIVTGALVVGLVAAVAVGLRTTGPSATARPDGHPVGQVVPGAEVPPPIDPAQARARAEAAGCDVVVDGAPLQDRSHLDPADAPPPAALYPDRPAHSGRHYGGLLALPDGTPTVPLDERAVLHNMEHGSVVVWFDPDVVSGQDRRSIAAWRDARADLGFTSSANGAVFASPMPDLDDPDAPAIALRAWGVAVDCARFDPLVADAFLVEHWGSHGAAPEADLSPYPDGSLRHRD